MLEAANSGPHSSEGYLPPVGPGWADVLRSSGRQTRQNGGTCECGGGGRGGRAGPCADRPRPSAGTSSILSNCPPTSLEFLLPKLNSDSHHSTQLTTAAVPARVRSVFTTPCFGARAELSLSGVRSDGLATGPRVSEGSANSGGH